MKTTTHLVQQVNGVGESSLVHAAIPASNIVAAGFKEIAIMPLSVISSFHGVLSLTQSLIQKEESDRLLKECL